MRISRSLSLVLALFVLAGCTGQSGVSLPLSSTATAPAPNVFVTHAPEPQGALQPFLDDWKTGDYASMYGLLTQDSQKAISAADFATRYDDAMTKLTLKELQYTIGAASINAASAVVNFHVTYKTNLIGELQRDLTANLKLENGQWRIAWEDGLIMPDLRGGNHIEMDPNVPARGNIYDRNHTPIVSQSDAVALGLIPGQINTDTEGSLLASLSDLVGLYPGTIAGMYANAGPDWYIPVGEVSQDDFKQKGGILNGFTGTYFYPYNTRFYANQIAPQAIGYVSPIQKGDELAQYIRLGYSPASSIGRSGIEKWGESILAGKTGGTLYVFDKDGKPVTELGKSDSQPASSIELTIDKNLQFQAQKALEGFRGAIVVLERNTGRVLAMASSPSYDPNLFDTKNQNSANGISNLVNDPETPQLNRAAQSKYPLGSVFKVVTFSAALESGTYTTTAPIYDCGYHFTEVAGFSGDDWTWEHYQNQLAAGDTVFTQPSGPLDLAGALMRSCNPFFWHVGKDLFDQGRVNAIADMARGFGLGKATGIGEIEEAPGNITSPHDEVEAVNRAIGQGDTQVTPLQVARMMAAIGNGGTLYRPQLVEKIIDPNGNATQVFKPEANAPPLPITTATLQALQAAMLQVVRNHRGTAYPRFEGITAGLAIYGKTGTAESGNGDSHAWFAGYTDQQNPDLPDIAIAVIAENAGEGSIVAAPMFKRMVEVYFYGKPLSPYPWETSIGITRTPTSPVTPTP